MMCWGHTHHTRWSPILTPPPHGPRVYVVSCKVVAPLASITARKDTLGVVPICVGPPEGGRSNPLPPALPTAAEGAERWMSGRLGTQGRTGSLWKRASYSLATSNLALLPYALIRCQQPEGERTRVLLEDKNAVIYGAGGSIGGAAARAFAREGAKVHLAGRTLESLEEVAEEIRSAGGVAETAQVDALDETAVDRHADAVAASAGGIDISFNLISVGEVQGTPLAEMPLQDFERPVMTAVRAQFLTSRAAARHMISQGSGVILFFGGYGDPVSDYYIGGFQVALNAIESLRRQLASELGGHGIRAVTLQTGGVPETIPESFDGREQITEMIAGSTMLGRAATLDDVGNVAAFAASDHARTMTATALNISCGAIVD